MEPDHLAERLQGGDPDALEAFFLHHRRRLRAMVELRLDWSLRGRLDPSDVLQDAYIDLARRVGEYVRDPRVPPFVWLRLVVAERLINLHRHHLGAQMRDPAREVSLYRGAMPGASSAALAAHLLGQHTSPSEAALRAERTLKLQEALNALDPIDREVLALRYFEQLSRSEAAEVLGISEEAAAKRYVRALKRLKAALASLPGGLEED
jgi:RNA polymerase sigma-70 factor (ECF subfamily)